MRNRARDVASVVCLATVAAFLAGCPNKPPQVTSVGQSVATYVRTGLPAGNVGSSACQPNPTPAAPNYNTWFAALPPANKNFPFAGFQLWRNTDPGCTSSRVDVYRALVTFNMNSVSNLKGLVTKAELVVATRALPASAGGAVTFPGVSTVTCPAFFGGAGSLQRFGPAAAAALPQLGSQGTLIVLQGIPAPPDPFPTATNTVYTFPSPPIVPGAVAGATNPTTVTASGTGGVAFASDVTSSVNSALNGGFAGMSWMLTSVFEGPLPGPVNAAGMLDCKTSYSFDLRLTHL